MQHNDYIILSIFCQRCFVSAYDDYIYFYNHQRIQLKTKLTPLELRSQFVA
ncbi:MAG: IS3 family transposase [Oscillospiraceae bacterium]|nr:IS3 family transposase [Oscillospiraceae bacterium]MBR4341269.1 IS3 family transposase [Lachnospiraceae bacterium]